jgi:flagellar assembly factor FliW
MCLLCLFLLQVNALVLTIPFALIPDFNFAYWTELQELLELCDSEAVRPFREVRFIYRASTLGMSELV